MKKIIFIPGAAGPRDTHIDTDSYNEQRCQRGLTLWLRGGYDMIVVSGFVGQLMRDWLRVRGVPAQKILADAHAADTFTNIRNSLRLLRERGYEDMQITAVSHWTHLNRIWLTFYLGYGRRIIKCPVPYRIRLRTFFWELGALVYHCLDWRGTGWIARTNRARRRRALRKK